MAIAIYDRNKPTQKWKLVSFVLDEKLASRHCRALLKQKCDLGSVPDTYQIGYVTGRSDPSLPSAFKGMNVPTSDQEENHAAA